MTLEEVTSERGKEQKAVIHFAEQHIKPMICNNVNWTTCEEAYGDESDFWAGKSVEIYVDPSVMFGAKKIGGVRLRIPTHGAARHAGNGTLWTFVQATAEAGKAGFTREQLIAMMKAKGFAGWNSQRDTPIVQELIASHAAPPIEEAFGNDIAPPPDMGGDISF